MIKAVQQLLSALEDLKTSNNELILLARERLEFDRQQRVNAQEHAVNTARERHRDRMRAWRAAHKKTEAFINGECK